MDLKESGIAYFEDTGRHPWELARFDVIMDLMKPLIRKHPDPEGAILDVGCGDLYFLSTLSNKFGKTKFIGLDPALDATMLEKYNTELSSKNILIYNDLNAIKTPSPFSFVLLLDVLEHIPDDVSVLQNLTRQPFISDDSLFIITVPAFQSLFCSHDTFLDHYRRYNNERVCALAGNAGLEVVSRGYFFFSLLLPRIVNVLSEKIMKPGDSRHPESKISNWNGSKAFTSFVKTFLLADYQATKFLRKMGINTVGLSNFMICKKRVL